MKVIKEISLAYAKVQLLSNKIIRLQMFANVVIGFNECREMNNKIGELSEGKEALILMVPDSSTYFAPESRDFSASLEGLKYTIADAMVVRNLGQKILVSFYLKFNKPPKPSKAFSTELQAMEWLLSINKKSPAAAEDLDLIKDM